MNLAELRAELEEDRAWRDQEIRMLQNRGSNIEGEEELNRYRRALVLLLYAHFEGFCKFALMLYASAINRSGLTCRHANYAIMAASLADVFRDLNNPQKKSSVFRRELPDDFKLHRFAREREFVERTREIEERQVKIPDHVVDTESNLTPTVLKKNLYRLGLPHDKFDTQASAINMLLSIRNGISHGDLREGVQETTYDQLRTATFSIMTMLSADVMRALSESSYMRYVD